MDVVYVYHNQIDARGDKTASENEVFNACEEAIEELAVFIRRLCTCSNVYHFMVTADHGFLYRRSKLQASDRISGIPNASRRYAISESSIEKDGVVNLSLSDILGTLDARYVSCPVGPDLFNAPGSGLNYIHGGCSPQEIIIPFIEAKLEKAKVETAKAKISLINLNNKITNLTTVNLPHLRQRLIESAYISADAPCDIEDVKEMLRERFDTIDYAQAKQDVEPFIHDTSVLNVWCAEFFKQITEKLTDDF